MNRGDAIQSVTHVADVDCYPCSGLNRRGEGKSRRAAEEKSKRPERGSSRRGSVERGSGEAALGEGRFRSGREEEEGSQLTDDEG